VRKTRSSPRRIGAAIAAATLLTAGGLIAASTSASASVCTATGPQDTCGPYDYSGITMSNGYDTYTENNEWGANKGTSQVLTSTDPGHWSLSATATPAGYTGVQTYPNIQQLTSNWTGNGWNGSGTADDTPLSGLSSLTSSFAQSMPHNSQTVAEAGYDIWTNYSSDIMIWVDNVNRGTGGSDQIGTATIGGQDFTVYQYGGKGGEIIFSLDGSGGTGTFANEASGSVDILGTLNWVQAHGYVSNIKIGQIDFGWEICTTGAQAETFSVSSYSLTGVPGKNSGGGSPSPSASPSTSPSATTTSPAAPTPTTTSPSAPTPTTTSPSAPTPTTTSPSAPTPTTRSPSAPTPTTTSPTASPFVVLAGDTNVESGPDSNVAGQAEAFPYKASASGTARSASFYLDSASMATKITVGVYSNNRGHPGALLAQAADNSLTAGAWNTVALPPVKMTAGTRYWIGLLGTGGTIIFRDTASGGGTSENSAQTSLTSLPSKWSSGPGWASSPASVYVSDVPSSDGSTSGSSGGPNLQTLAWYLARGASLVVAIPN